MKSIDHSFYKSQAWLTCRDTYLAKHSLCERCLKDGIITPAKIVHHKVWLNKNNVNDASISLNHDNLEALCQDCHNKEHHAEEKIKRWKFNSEGELEFSNR